MVGLQIFDAQGRLILDATTLLLKQVAIIPTTNSVTSGEVNVPAAAIPPISVPVPAPAFSSTAIPSTLPTVEYQDNGATKKFIWRKQSGDVDMLSTIRVDMF